MSDNILALMDAGKWVPCGYGNRYQICRLGRDRRRTQETRPTPYSTLGEAQAECDRLNKRR